MPYIPHSPSVTILYDNPVPTVIFILCTRGTVPRACVFDLWEAFNDVAEGFGLTIIEFREMLQCSLKEYLGFSETRMVELADTVFGVFDDDKVYSPCSIAEEPTVILLILAYLFQRRAKNRLSVRSAK